MVRTATTEQVAEALHVGPATVRKYAREHRLPYDTTPGGHRRFDVEEAVEAILGSRTADPTAQRSRCTTVPVTWRTGRPRHLLPDRWTATTGDGHEQGDLLRGLPVVHVEQVDLSGTPTVRSQVQTIDAILVTQTCDLENEKIRNILLARVVSWADFAAAQFAAENTAVKGRSFRRNLIRGDIPPLMLLHERQAQPRLAWSISDFRELHVVERCRIDLFVAQPGNRRRLRLRSPYKEHFAQAFADGPVRAWSVPSAACSLRAPSIT